MNIPENVRSTHFFGFSTVPELLFESLLREYADNGATQLSMSDVMLRSFLADPNKAVAFRALLDKTGVSFPDIHGFWGGLWDLCSPDTFMRPHLVAGQRLGIEISADFGAKTYTIHVGNPPKQPDGAVLPPDHLDRVSAVLDGILPTAERCGMVVCVENSFKPGGMPAFLGRLFDRYRGAAALGCCLDVGHAHILDPEARRPEGEPIVSPAFDADVWSGHLREGMLPFRDVMAILAPHIVTTHVHDNNGLRDQHLCPGQGTIDFDAVFAELAKCPRLQSVQDETGLRGSGVSLAHVCRVFERLMGRA